MCRRATRWSSEGRPACWWWSRFWPAGCPRAAPRESTRSPRCGTNENRETMLRSTLTFLLLGGVLFAQSADKLDALFAPLATGKTPGLAVMVRQNGKTLAQRAYGV